MSAPIHVCLVSGQLLPNLMPIIHYDADQVYLLTTADMKLKGKRLQEILKSRKIDSVIRGGVPDTGLADIMSYAEDFARELAGKHDSRNILFNMTGGTKLMVMGFIFAFDNILESLRIIYTDTEHKRFDRLEDSESFSEPIPDNLVNVSTYLEAQGCSKIHAASDNPVWRARAHQSQRAALTRYMAENARELGIFFSKLNECAGKSFFDMTENGRKKEQFDSKKEFPQFRFNVEDAFAKYVWDEMASLGITTFEGNRFRFSDEISANYSRGFWLEEYAWLVGSNLGLADFCVDIHFRWQQEGSEVGNSFDAVAIHNNWPLFVECKTIRYGKQEKGQEIVYKLDSLAQRFAGVVGDKLLLSALPLDNAAKNRAKAAGIEVLEGSQLASLENRLRRLLK